MTRGVRQPLQEMRNNSPSNRSIPVHLRHSLVLVGKTVFAHRLLLGLSVVVVAALFIRPSFPANPGAGLLEMLSVILVLTGVMVRAWAAGCAGGHTRTSNIEAGKLATGGPYAFVRNPIYLASIFIGIGMVGVIGDWRLLPVCLGTFAALYFAIIPAEEEFLQRKYPSEYQVYCTNVRRLWPRLRPWSGARHIPFDWRPALREWQIVLILVSILIFLDGVAFLRGAYNFGP
jgi:protein-S-isoprenylcysteine O-methyltransferase Ste14